MGSHETISGSTCNRRTFIAASATGIAAGLGIAAYSSIEEQREITQLEEQDKTARAKSAAGAETQAEIKAHRKAYTDFVDQRYSSQQIVGLLLLLGSLATGTQTIRNRARQK